MPSVASPTPTLPPDAFASWCCPCGVTWNAVPEQLWLLTLQRTPAFSRTRCRSDCTGRDGFAFPSSTRLGHTSLDSGPAAAAREAGSSRAADGGAGPAVSRGYCRRHRGQHGSGRAGCKQRIGPGMTGPDRDVPSVPTRPPGPAGHQGRRPRMPRVSRLRATIAVSAHIRTFQEYYACIREAVCRFCACVHRRLCQHTLICIQSKGL